MGDVIKFEVGAPKEEKPDSDFVRYDEDGRPLYYFMIGYSMAGSSWSCRVWAYSMEDAQSRLNAIRVNGTIMGQAFSAS